MPIIGLTDRVPRLPLIGILRKGGEKRKGKNKKGEDIEIVGSDLDYFRFDTDDEAAAAAFRAAYGAEPRSIHVFVPFATADENFEAWREDWVASSLKHRCDGQTCVRHLTAKGTYSDEPIPCPGDCKQVGRLKLILPELKRFAIVTALTTSIHDILEIHSNLLALETARGSLQGIPLLLKRTSREISTPAGNGKRVRREKWLLSVEAQPQWVELQLAAQQQAALPAPSAASPLLLNPRPEDFEEEDSDGEVEPAAFPRNMGNVRPFTAAAQSTVAGELTPPEESAVNIFLLDYCLKEKKNQKAAEAYFKGVYGSKSAAERRTAAIKLGWQPARDKADLIAQIESQIAELTALGISDDEIREIIAACNSGIFEIEQLAADGLYKTEVELRETIHALKTRTAKAAA